MSQPTPLSLLLERKTALLDLKLCLMAIQIQRTLHKYRPDQPRAPRGSTLGGQWVDEGADEPIDVAGAYDPRRAAVCEAQQIKDEELCRAARSPICWGLANDRYAACMKNNYIPTLRF